MVKSYLYYLKERFPQLQGKEKRKIINDGCGAVHLDPGEIEKILKGERGLFGKVKHSLSSILK